MSLDLYILLVSSGITSSTRVVNGHHGTTPNAFLDVGKLNAGILKSNMTYSASSKCNEIKRNTTGLQLNLQYAMRGTKIP
ncbi:hypothetical protein NPIL_202831 [Nephila pilipes]|uniref:Uncharacterized protein n=1 Tax=Nephila pilipes TaxID=299642 RepID=A0A8X6N6U5_NEPPI|nr:hypothetical protein NPIL_202831 [Nephila pilipes]